MIKDLGYLICLICIYLIVGDWGGFGETLGGYGFFIGILLSLIGILSKKK